jgi:hypothetical protein
MAFTVLGETFLLMGFVLFAAGNPSGRDAALALTILALD